MSFRVNATFIGVLAMAIIGQGWTGIATADQPIARSETSWAQEFPPGTADDDLPMGVAAQYRYRSKDRWPESSSPR